MSNYIQWDESCATGDTALDEQHRDLLARCNALADCLRGDGSEYGAAFQQQFDALVDFVRHLFVAEQTRLGDCPALGEQNLREHNDEIDEFEFLVADVATEDNFDAVEVQRFLSLWSIGHVVGFAAKYRDHLLQPPSC